MSADTVSNEQFLAALFEDAPPDTYTVVASFPGDPNAATRRDWAGFPWARGQALRWGFDSGNTYLTVSAFTPDPQTGDRRRRKVQFAALMALMIDDVGTKVPRERILLPATAEIETSPANFQAYYFLKQNAASRDRGVCERVIKAMIKTGLATAGKDPGMNGVTRFARLPNGVNGKAKYVSQLGRPFRTRCVALAPHRRYEIEEIAAAWELDTTAAEREWLAPELTADQVAQVGARFAALIETLKMLRMYKQRIGPGPWHEIQCPWIAEHTDRADSGAAICEPTADNRYRGGFRCHHGHGEAMHLSDVHEFIRAVIRELEQVRA